jgi:hypothetical protein
MKLTISIGFLFLLSCQTRQEQRKPTADMVRLDSIQQLRKDSIERAATQLKKQMRLDSLADIVKAKPIWGKRMKVIGDFNGDGAQDTLYEQYISRLTGEETNKDYDFTGSELGDECCDWLDYKQKWIQEKDPLVRLVSLNPSIKPFNVEWGDVQNGFGYLQNVGDLNQDSTDEIVYYIYDVDMSNTNSAALATYKNGKWKEVHHWEIMEQDFWHTEGEPKPNPVYVKREGNRVFCKEMDGETGGYVWKRLNTNW